MFSQRRGAPYVACRPILLFVTLQHPWPLSPTTSGWEGLIAVIKYGNIITCDSRVGSFTNISSGSSWMSALQMFTYYTSVQLLANLHLFRLDLAKSLIGSYNSRKRAPPTATPVPRPPHPHTMLHFPIKKRTGSRKGVSRCWYCAHTRAPPKRKETLWYCEECELHLCHTGIRLL